MKKRLVIALLLGLFVCLPVGLAIRRWANSSNQAVISITETRDSGQQSTTQPLETAYFRTLVPYGWKIQKDTNTATASRLQVVAFAPSGTSGQLAITTDLLPSDGLAGVADYHLRISDPAQYVLFTDSSFPQNSQAFKNTSGAPLHTLFLVHAGRYASITVSSESSETTSLTRLRAAITDWQWL